MNYSVIQGESGPFVEVYADPAIMPNVDGWSCTETLTAPDGTVVIDRPVATTNQDGTRFIAVISEADTDSLTVDTYVWQLKLTNTSLQPGFEVTTRHTIYIEPPGGTQSNLELARGENSFADYPELIDGLTALPELTAAQSADRIQLKAAAVSSWFDIGALKVDLANGITTSRYLDAEALDALPMATQRDLLRAQLQQADFIIGTPTHLRDNNIRRQTVGESTTVWRNGRRVLICPDATETLRPYLAPGQQYTARMHP